MSRYLIIVSRFNEPITRPLFDGAKDCLNDHRIGYETIWVPGAFELPLVAQEAARSKKFDAIICLGCVIRGETAHFDYVASEAARGILLAGLEARIPIIFGVLTTENADQARARSGGSRGNRGRDAAEAAIEMVDVLQKLRDPGGNLGRG